MLSYTETRHRRTTAAARPVSNIINEYTIREALVDGTAAAVATGRYALRGRPGLCQRTYVNTLS